MHSTSDQAFVAAFEAGHLAPSTFDHRAHVRVACALLRERPFLDACIAMRDGLQRLATAAGKPDLYHETITVALMSALLDRLAGLAPASDVESLITGHPALLDRSMLAAHYSPALLASPAARRRFVLPDRPAHSSDPSELTR